VPYRLLTIPPRRRADLTQFANLILGAIAIQKDLSVRIARRPHNAALRRQRETYVVLIDRLIAEHDRAFDQYLREVERRYAQFVAASALH
jgi:hypothetical protein